MSSSTQPIVTPEEQLQFELFQHQQHLAQVQATQAAEMAQLAAQATPNPVKAQANLDLQRQLLQQKLADKSVLSFLDPNGLNNRGIAGMASPTDSMMSPCTKKLQQQKQRLYGKSSKPRLLTQAFAAAAQAEKEKENHKSTSGNLFGAAKTPIPKDEPIF